MCHSLQRVFLNVPGNAGGIPANHPLANGLANAAAQNRLMSQAGLVGRPGGANAAAAAAQAGLNPVLLQRQQYTQQQPQQQYTAAGLNAALGKL